MPVHSERLFEDEQAFFSGSFSRTSADDSKLLFQDPIQRLELHMIVLTPVQRFLDWKQAREAS